MTFLSRDQILNTSLEDFEEVDLSDFYGDDVTARIRTMSAKEADEYNASIMDYRKDGNHVFHMDRARYTLVAKCLVDEQGNRMFNDKDASKLGEHLTSAAMDRLYKACQSLNATRQEDMEELEKN